jgi:hypothetical protein
MADLTGFWVLNNELSSEQNRFMAALGRPIWERKAIDKADEDFILFHHKLEKGDKVIHCLDKDVTIYLKATIIKLLSLFIEYDKVHYNHIFVANNKPVLLKDDEKHLGDCTAALTWNSSRNGFMLVWKLKKHWPGTLSVFHRLRNHDQMEIEMSYKSDDGKHTGIVTKVYDRKPLTPTMITNKQSRYNSLMKKMNRK